MKWTFQTADTHRDVWLTSSQRFDTIRDACKAMACWAMANAENDEQIVAVRLHVVRGE